jgi:hypothetical protein
MMTPEDITIVAEDLEYIASWNPNTGVGDVRRGSAVLRRLLIEGVYSRAWRYCGKSGEPKLDAIDLGPIVDSPEMPWIEIAVAGDTDYRSPPVTIIIMEEGLNSDGSKRKSSAQPIKREFGLMKFVQSPAGINKGKVFTRSDVIKYIANVKGGVHLSGKQRQKEKDLIKRMSKVEGRVTAAKTDGLLIELVAIAQAVGRSPDAQELIEYARSYT